MIIKQELIKKIRDYFNLNIYETKVWLALLGKGIASAGEIAESSGVPRSRTYDVLESLEKSGFTISKLGKPARYIAVRPAIILEKMKNNTIKEAEEKVDILSKLKQSAEYTELEGLYNTGIIPIKHEEISGAIKGKTTIYGHLKEILENAKKEVIICTSVKDFSDKLRFFTGIITKLNKEKINVKVALSGQESEIKKIAAKSRLKIKKIDISAKFFIVDREQVLFTLAESSIAEDEIAIWLNTEFFTNAMVYLFNQVWED
mgnify:CR=1 FL=1